MNMIRTCGKYSRRAISIEKEEEEERTTETEGERDCGS